MRIDELHLREDTVDLDVLVKVEICDPVMRLRRSHAREHHKNGDDNRSHEMSL